MPPRSGGAAGVEGVWSSSLAPASKLAILATPGVFERYIQLADFAATLLRRKLIDRSFYERIVSGDPIISLARQTHRVGTTEWARKVYSAGDPTVPVAAASTVLGVDPETRRPVLKRQMGVDDQDLPGLMETPDVKPRAGKKSEPTPRRASGDGVSVHPDEVPVESYTRNGARPQGGHTPKRVPAPRHALPTKREKDVLRWKV